MSFADVGGCGREPALIDLPADEGSASSPAVAIDLSSDEASLVVARADGTVTRYETATGQGRVLLSPDDGSLGPATLVTAATTVGSDLLVIGRDRGANSQLLVGDRPAVELSGHDDAVRWVAGDAVESRLFLGGETGVITEVSADEGRTTATFTARRRGAVNDPAATVRGLRYLPDAGVLLAVQDFRATAWELDPDALIEVTCRRVGRDLTAAERTRLGVPTDLPVCPRG